MKEDKQSVQLEFFDELVDNMHAVNTFISMTNSQKEDIIQYIKKPGTSEDVKVRIDEVIKTLDFS